MDTIHRSTTERVRFWLAVGISTNGGGNGNHGNGNRNGMNEGAGGNAPVASVCTYKDFLNCQPHNFSGTEGVMGFGKVVQENVVCKDTYELKNQSYGKQAANSEARGRAYALGGGEPNQDSNVVIVSKMLQEVLKQHQRGIVENYKNVSQDIRDQLMNAEAEAVQIILTGIDNDIYSTVDACPNACEMWKAIERLKQGESINVQDLETNLYWEFGKFTSRDGESLESYYSRFVTLVKKSQELKIVSYHKLYDILKQHQNEVNEIRAERLAHHSKQPETEEKQLSTLMFLLMIKNLPWLLKMMKCQRKKEIDKLMALISLSFKKIYNLPTTTFKLLQTSSNTSRANQDNSPRINRGTGYKNQRAVNVARARENAGTSIVQKSGIQCYNCKEYGHLSRECQKLKCAKDAAYQKEKMLLYKQEEAVVQLNADQGDWKDDTDDESDDQELEHYMYMAQIQEVTPDVADNFRPNLNSDPCTEEQGDTNITIDSLDMSTNGETVDQDDDDLANERDLLATLIDKLNVKLMTTKTAYKTREEKELEKVIALENKIKVLDDIVYKTSQSVQTMNMLNRNYKTSFVKPEFLKKAQRANPRLYDIGCYNDNLALMLAPDSDEMIRLAQDSRSKLSDLIRPFNYEKLNNLYDLFVPQREKSPEQ
ncbi:retrovirus-related pol polyprotein from transposon TNT 1-94 [Tanacetum coccineum]|uniref:Retrovirus-related pol polyprotein from transposon TNT 1-94 n=1 Tax=Tanacetum coccineum TaxID=301880 RepID=A0ABQ5AJ55_9ASTR